jgi:hypothetical protein
VGVPGRNKFRVLLACAVALAALIVAPLSARAANVDVGGSVLHTGHCLAATASQPVALLSSFSTRFALVLDRSNLRIRNELMLTDSIGAGYTTWIRSANRIGARSASLCMQTNGNLVLRGNGSVAWSTHTAGTGAHNYALMRNNGRLVVRTASDRTVWSSHTTRVLLKAGDRLESGHTLTNLTDPSRVTHLQMRTSGDLVLSRGRTTVWHTDTHVPGSYLLVTSAGRMAVYSPAQHLVWRSTAVGRTPLLTVERAGQITLKSFTTGRCATRPAESACG